MIEIVNCVLLDNININSMAINLQKGQKIDIEFITWLGEESIPFSVVFTKSDKLSKSALQSNINNYESKLLEYWEQLPPIFVSSSEKGIGREEILEYIAQINKSV